MEGTSFIWSIALFNKSYLDLVRSSLILTPLFNLFLALWNIVLWGNVVKCIIILLQQLFEEASKYLEPILWARLITDSRISTLAYLNKDFTESNTSSLDSLVFADTPSIRRQRRLPYCSNSSWLFWFDMFNLLNSDTWCFSIWFSDSKCLQWLLISLWVCLVISSWR